MGLKFKETGFFSRNEVPAEFQSVKDFATTAFALPANSVGQVIETPEGAILFRVKEKRQPSDSPYQDVRDQVVAALKKERAQERARKIGEEILRDLKAGKSLRAAASLRGLKVEATAPFSRRDVTIPGIGVAQDLKKDAFTLSPGKSEALNKVYTFQGEALVAVLKEKIPADMAAFEKSREALKAEAIQRKQIEVLAGYQEALYESAFKAKRIEMGEGYQGADLPS
jgi:parvulin-like peptidyl-prolyl isomerase